MAEVPFRFEEEAAEEERRRIYADRKALFDKQLANPGTWAPRQAVPMPQGRDGMFVFMRPNSDAVYKLMDRLHAKNIPYRDQFRKDGAYAIEIDPRDFDILFE